MKYDEYCHELFGELFVDLYLAYTVATSEMIESQSLVGKAMELIILLQSLKERFLFLSPTLMEHLQPFGNDNDVYQAEMDIPVLLPRLVMDF